MTRNPHIWFLVSSLYFLSSFSCSSTSMYLLLFLVVVFLDHVLEVFRVSDFGLNCKQVLFHLIDFLIFEISRANVAVAPLDLLWLVCKPESWFWLWRSLLGLVVRQSVILKFNLKIFCFATCIFYNWRETRIKIFVAELFIFITVLNLNLYFIIITLKFYLLIFWNNLTNRITIYFMYLKISLFFSYISSIKTYKHQCCSL